MMAEKNDDDAAAAGSRELQNIPPADDPITVQEVELLARKRLPKAVYDYYACGADDQDALKRNLDAFTR
jgi:hypothetical protein